MKEEQLFHEALEQPAERRAAYLDAACQGDAKLRDRIELLLRVHANPGSFLVSPSHRVDLGVNQRPRPTGVLADVTTGATA